MKKLNRGLLKYVSGGGRVPYAFCNDDGICPKPVGNRVGYCDGGTCYYDTKGTTGPGPGCTLPTRLCTEGETGCECVYS
ncbi:hypothetical protein [Elizabethkingia anophelis]|uniref:hypothetical protein n=1 Tax=Elizabethkingia anophelis TaxID=1117645 RepID=UPI003891E9DB